MSLVTLTTDFGDTAPYAAVMKGVVLSLNPAARVVDLSHRIRPHDVRHASYLLGTAAPYFPPGTVHVCVVDPGVGSDRPALYAEAGGQRFVGPDNGAFTAALKHLGGPDCVRRLENPAYWREPVSRTFHGRDVFAPVAARLTLGLAPEELGPAATDWVELPTRSAVCWGSRCEGEVQFVDDFGNLITNIPERLVKALPVHVSLNGGPPTVVPWVRTYSDAAAGELVSLASSDGFFEIAAVNANAAARLSVGIGAAVELKFG